MDWKNSRKTTIRWNEKSCNSLLSGFFFLTAHIIPWDAALRHLCDASRCRISICAHSFCCAMPQSRVRLLYRFTATGDLTPAVTLARSLTGRIIGDVRARSPSVVKRPLLETLHPSTGKLSQNLKKKIQLEEKEKLQSDVSKYWKFNYFTTRL